jgi:HEAT repeats
MVLSATFETLATTANPSAVDALITALDVPRDAIQAAAVSALLRRREAQGLMEIVRRLDGFDEAIRREVFDAHESISRVVRACLHSEDRRLRMNGLTLLCEIEEYRALPALLPLLDAPDEDLRNGAGRAIRDLAERLYWHLQFGIQPRVGETVPHDPSSGKFLRDAQRVRHQMLGDLDAAVQRHPDRICREVVEASLILGVAGTTSLRRLLIEGSETLRQVALGVLVNETHPGVLRLICESLGENHLYPAVISAVEQRSDAAFVRYFLGHWPREITLFQRKSLERIGEARWLWPEHLSAEVITPERQRPLAEFVVLSGLTESRKLEILEWLVRNGGPEGRLAATQVLVEYEHGEVRNVVLEGLRAEETHVQVWATEQLRAWSIPNAMELLLGRLDSPSPEVRQAARGELGDFDMMRVLDLFPHLEARLYASVGQVVRKTDPRCLETLANEMRHAIRRRRVLAAHAALAFQMQVEVFDALFDMARDPDNLIRRTAADVLGSIDTPEALAVLNDLRHDPSQRVREAVQATLDKRQAHVPGALGERAATRNSPLATARAGGMS